MRATTPARIAALVFFAAMMVCAMAPAAQREPSAPKELVERIGAWSEVFLTRCPSFVATETRQEYRMGRKGSAGPAQTFVAEYEFRRDDSGQPLESWRPLAADAKGAKGKPAESAARPVGPQNPVTLVARLAERNLDKMRFFFPQDTSETLSDYVLVGYRQTEGEGLAEMEGKPVYPRGQVWVDPDNGRIVRIEDEVSYKGARFTAEVEFGDENEMKAWLPRQIILRTFEKNRLQQQVVITYNGFRAPSADRAGGAGPASKP
jgi:hypothetical protein